MQSFHQNLSRYHHRSKKWAQSHCPRLQKVLNTNLRNSFIFSEDNWPPEDYVLKENEILINRPLFPCVGMGNSIIVQDEHGFKYRKSHNTRHATHIQNWKCSKINHGCKCSIKTRGETIIMQRNQHNHDVNEYKQFKKFWIKLNFHLIAEDKDWNIEDVVLRESDILINRPYFPCVGKDNSIIVQDEHGFRYRKANQTKKEQHLVNWRCSRVNKGCRCSIRTRGGMIIFQRNDHNHDALEYKYPALVTPRLWNTKSYSCSYWRWLECSLKRKWNPKEYSLHHSCWP